MTTYTKSEIFKMAWQTARVLASTAGTGAKAQFATALRQTYASVRELASFEASEVETRDARLQDLDAEIETLSLTIAKAGVRASSMKDSARARIQSLRAEYALLAA